MMTCGLQNAHKRISDGPFLFPHILFLSLYTSLFYFSLFQIQTGHIFCTLIDSSNVLFKFSFSLTAFLSFFSLCAQLDYLLTILICSPASITQVLMDRQGRVKRQISIHFTALVLLHFSCINISKWSWVKFARIMSHA